MADEKISALDTVTSMADSLQFPVNNGGVNEKVVYSVMKLDVQDVNSLNEKASIVNNDVLLMNDSAATNAPKKIKNSTIKSNIQDIISLTNKATPIGADLVMINDSAAANAPKKALISSLPVSVPYKTTSAGTNIKSGGTGTNFTIKKPISCYVTITGGGSNGIFGINQGGSLRTIITATGYSLQLNPGNYSFTSGVGSGMTLYCTGGYGTSTINAGDIVT